jgi:hypothetical protein
MCIHSSLPSVDLDFIYISLMHSQQMYSDKVHKAAKSSCALIYINVYIYIFIYRNSRLITMATTKIIRYLNLNDFYGMKHTLVVFEYE